MYKTLAYLNGKISRINECKYYYKKAILYNPDDYEAQIEYAYMLIENAP